MRGLKILSIFVGLFIIASAVFLFWETVDNNQQAQTERILFYGKGCLHCLKVEEFIKENNIESKIKFERREVFYDKKNANLLAKKAKECGIEGTQIAVPFLYNKGQCVIGDKEIVEFFKTQ